MDQKDSSEPAEKISDEELRARVAAVLETSDAPFVTTSEVVNVVDELKSDQLRNRLKKLANEEGTIAYTNSRGLVFWTPNDAGEVSGKVDTIIKSSEPNWDDISADQVPPALADKIIQHRQDQRQSTQFGPFSDATSQVGIYSFLFAVIISFIASSNFGESIPYDTQNLVAILLAVSLLSFSAHASVVIYRKATTWAENHKDLLGWLSR
jgi:hypothetical protein